MHNIWLSPTVVGTVLLLNSWPLSLLIINELLSVYGSVCFYLSRVTCGIQRMILKQGWCEIEWEVCVCVLNGLGVTGSQVLAKSWQDQTDCLSWMCLHLHTSPQGRAVCQRQSSLYLSPCLSHPFFRGILSSTHLFIQHVKDKQTDTTCNTSRFTADLHTLADTHIGISTLPVLHTN